MVTHTGNFHHLTDVPLHESQAPVFGLGQLAMTVGLVVVLLALGVSALGALSGVGPLAVVFGTAPTPIPTATDTLAPPTLTPIPTATPIPHGFTRFSIPTSNAGLTDITVGPDGNLWFVESQAGKVGRLTLAGEVEEFAMPHSISGITVGPDNSLWIAGAGALTKMTTSGTIVAAYPLPTPSDSARGVLSGPGGALWFIEFGTGKIGRMSPTGDLFVKSEFPVQNAAYAILKLAVGSDNSVWYTVCSTKYVIGKMGLSGNTEYPFPTHTCSTGLTAGPDGNIWFTEEEAHKIGRVTLSGTMTEFPVPAPGGAPGPNTTGPDGNLWFGAAGILGKITPAGTTSAFPLPSGVTGITVLVAGPNSGIWFVDGASNIIVRYLP